APPISYWARTATARCSICYWAVSARASFGKRPAPSLSCRVRNNKGDGRYPCIQSSVSSEGERGMKLRRIGLLGLFALAVGAAGCATSGGGADNEAMIRSTLGVFKEGIESGDIEKLMSSYSDDF